MADNFLIPANDAKAFDLDELMEQDPMFLKIIAARDDTHPAILAHLARHGNMEIRCSVARNPKTPPEILAVLADVQKDRDGYVANSDIIQEVTANPSTPQSVLGMRIRNGSHGHINALKNSNSPLQSILEYMLAQVGADERGALIFNQRFNDLIRMAGKLDAEHEERRIGLNTLTADDFDNDDDHDGSQWS